MLQNINWSTHVVRAGTYTWSEDNPKPEEHKKNIEPWLSALLQAEHLNLLVGSGLTRAIASQVGSDSLDMEMQSFQSDLDDIVKNAAKESAKRCQRQNPNFEDQIRVILELIGGLRILASGAKPGREGSRLVKSAVPRLKQWEDNLNNTLREFSMKILKTERDIKRALQSNSSRGEKARYLLASFLLTFSSRAASRERLHIFTTNYDRLIEYGCDLLGLRILDRFVGQLVPIFRSSRLGVDFHYNPPGIRGEPRYLEGVVRLTKLHGSIDWRQEKEPSGRHEIRRCGLPFGASVSEAEAILPSYPGNSLIIYPNPAKDMETLEYPYADLFRDFAAAVCQPNTVVVTYGYGFGDDHINRVLSDMLTIPSTHLAIISYDNAGGRIEEFYENVGHNEQITLLIGNHFGEISTLVEYYLPKPAIDRTTWRMVELLNRRTSLKEDGKEDGKNEDKDFSFGGVTE